MNLVHMIKKYTYSVIASCTPTCFLHPFWKCLFNFQIDHSRSQNLLSFWNVFLHSRLIILKGQKGCKKQLGHTKNNNIFLLNLGTRKPRKGFYFLHLILFPAPLDFKISLYYFSHIITFFFLNLFLLNHLTPP